MRKDSVLLSNRSAVAARSTVYRTILSAREPTRNSCAISQKITFRRTISCAFEWDLEKVHDSDFCFYVRFANIYFGKVGGQRDLLDL